MIMKIVKVLMLMTLLAVRGIKEVSSPTISLIVSGKALSQRALA